MRMIIACPRQSIVLGYLPYKPAPPPFSASAIGIPIIYVCFVFGPSYFGFMASIPENLSAVRDRIAAAAKRSGRSARDVKLVAVTKYVEVDAIGQLINASCLDLGES